jgi:hypothetical protein
VPRCPAGRGNRRPLRAQRASVRAGLSRAGRLAVRHPRASVDIESLRNSPPLNVNPAEIELRRYRGSGRSRLPNG